MAHRAPTIPPAIDRAPNPALLADIATLESRVLAVVQSVAERIGSRSCATGGLSASADTGGQAASGTQATVENQLLLSMLPTHASIVQLLEFARTNPQSVMDTIPLARGQVEKCFLGLLLADDPGKWLAALRKNAWETLALRFWRNQAALGALPEYATGFQQAEHSVVGQQGQADYGVSQVEARATRAKLDGAPYHERESIRQVPTPGRIHGRRQLTLAPHIRLAELLYPFYDELSNFAHVGYGEAVVGQDRTPGRRDAETPGQDRTRGHGDTETRRETGPVSRAVPGPGGDTGGQAASGTPFPGPFDCLNIGDARLTSLLAMLVLATLLGVPGNPSADLTGADGVPASTQADAALRSQLRQVWTPAFSDGCALGILLYDRWARDVLGRA